MAQVNISYARGLVAVHAYTGARRNLLQYSQRLEQVSAWPDQGLSIYTADTATAPDGTLTADTLTAKPVGYGGLARQYYNYAGAQVYTLSWYVKQVTHRYVGIRMNDIGRIAGDLFNVFDLQAGAWIVARNETASGFEALGSGWFRIWITGTPSAGNTVTDLAIVLSDGRESTTKAGTEAVYLWGAQLVTGSDALVYEATPYPTLPDAAIQISYARARAATRQDVYGQLTFVRARVAIQPTHGADYLGGVTDAGDFAY